MRLQRYLASCGLGSRRACEAIIEAGRVSVNGVAANLGKTVDPDTDVIEVDGSRVEQEATTYILIHKPRGVVTTAEDTHGRETVIDLVHAVPARVVPVGRLDLDVSGVLLMMNDGELAHRLTHPKFGVEKTYLVEVEGEFDDDAIKKLERGVDLEDGCTAPAHARVVDAGPTSTIELTVHEGRNHLVKRMCAAVGHPVKKLTRTAFATLTCNGVKPGQWRELTIEEVSTLRKLTQLQPLD